MLAGLRRTGKQKRRLELPAFHLSAAAGTGRRTVVSAWLAPAVQRGCGL
ncbi:hypothetical protein D8I24_3384 [Cupriavidus necator H850]|nr:hypothetical protein D8I24_3384 [Cupriavidus necator H850]